MVLGSAKHCSVTMIGTTFGFGATEHAQFPAVRQPPQAHLISFQAEAKQTVLLNVSASRATSAGVGRSSHLTLSRGITTLERRSPSGPVTSVFSVNCCPAALATPKSMTFGTGLPS